MDSYQEYIHKSRYARYIPDEKRRESWDETVNRYLNFWVDRGIKLSEQEIIYGNKSHKFKLDLFKKKCLIEGLDDIALSLEKTKHIETFENKLTQNKPWILNNG